MKQIFLIFSLLAVFSGRSAFALNIDNFDSGPAVCVKVGYLDVTGCIDAFDPGPVSGYAAGTSSGGYARTLNISSSGNHTKIELNNTGNIGVYAHSQAANVTGTSSVSYSLGDTNLTLGNINALRLKIAQMDINPGNLKVTVTDTAANTATVSLGTMDIYSVAGWTLPAYADYKFSGFAGVDFTHVASVKYEIEGYNPSLDMVVDSMASTCSTLGASGGSGASPTSCGNAAISGKVFRDDNNNGVFDGTDAGIDGVTLTLSGYSYGANGMDEGGPGHGDDTAVPGGVTALTAGGGDYSFTGRPPGNYTVTETEPAGYSNGITTPGSMGGTATLVATTPSQISNINLNGANATANNFAEILATTATLSGKVYVDSNNDGVADSGETGINDVTVTLTGYRFGPNASDDSGAGDDIAIAPVNATTVGGGNYSFPGLVPGKYTVTEPSQPGGTNNGITTPGAVGGGVATVVAVTPSVVSGIVVNGANSTGNNFGETLSASLIPPIVNGYVFLDRNHTRDRQTANPVYRSGWTVILKQGGTTLCQVETDDNGFYQFDNLTCNGRGLNSGLPDYTATGLPTGAGFTIEFFSGNAKANNLAISTAGTPGAGTISSLTLSSGAQVIEQNLPLDPSGVVYDAVTRVPVAGAAVQLTFAGAPVPSGCLGGGANPVTTAADGSYAFILQDSVTCTYSSGAYTLTVVSYPTGYVQAPSTLLPACQTAGTNTTLNVVAGGISPALIQSSALAPQTATSVDSDGVTRPAWCATTTAAPYVGQGSTQHYFVFNLTKGVSADVRNNHIPLDPLSSPPLLFTKTTPLVNVARGELVPYTITARNTRSVAINGVTLSDQIPPGFKYKIGSASLDGVATEPTVAGRLLTWTGQNFAVGQTRTIRMLLVVGSGVGEGAYGNRVWGAQGAVIVSNTATATVRVVPDPTFDCSDLIGKVFDDQNANGYQDEGEPGIANVRIATARGLLVTTDKDGRFHVACADIPQAQRGSNFIMKLDERSLPSGYRITTENPREVRTTRGKMVKLNFGAAIHRVVRLELTDAAFLAGKPDAAAALADALEKLPATLRVKPSVVRLAYQAGKEDAALASVRLRAVRERLEELWKVQGCCYTLVFEEEIFERAATKKGGAK